MSRSVPLYAFVVLSMACTRETGTPEGERSKPAASTTADQTPVPTFGEIKRADFNELAVLAAEPVFWVEDTNNDGRLQPDEFATYAAYGKSTPRSAYVTGNTFNAAFGKLFDRLAKLRGTSQERAKTLPPEEAARQKAVAEELAAGRVSIVRSNFADLSPGLRKATGKILEAAAITERIYQKQMGVFEVKPGDEEASRALLWRNQSPRCSAPQSAGNPACHATKEAPPEVQSGLYPASLLAKKDFCDGLKSNTDKSLADQFTVVTEEGGKLKAVPYHVHYADDLGPLAALLDEAAGALEDDEAALRDYLKAAGKAMRDGSWYDADEAWAKMNAQNSKVYLRIGPDEVYAEPCSTKALFHTSFGRINQASLALQSKFDPKKQEMEQTLGALAGAPYKARQVTFRLPDFMDVAWNAGDARPPSGATIGQSLPNFGPVANQGRGRTVAMTNFYLDADNVAAAKKGAEALLCKDTLSRYTSTPDAQILSTVLHEAAHNLGPAHQYKVKGQEDRIVFGGPLASTLEELKAQSSALFLADWLKEKGELDARQADEAHVRDLTWAFGHISRGMTDDAGHPRNYSQLAAIQLGMLRKDGAVVFREEEMAANATDKGCFSLDAAKFPAAAKSMVSAVLQVKGKGDKAMAEQWLKQYVAPESAETKLHAIIRERLLRSPKASFVYSVDLGADAPTAAVPAKAPPAASAAGSASTAPSTAASAPKPPASK